MLFADTLSSLADKQNSVRDDDRYLDVYAFRRFLLFFVLRRYHARLFLRFVNDGWRVMLSDPETPEGPFFGVDYSTTEGEDAASATRGVWDL